MFAWSTADLLRALQGIATACGYLDMAFAAVEVLTRVLGLATLRVRTFCRMARAGVELHKALTTGVVCACCFLKATLLSAA